MPCDCPDDQPRPVPSGGCDYLVYSGGPWSSFYQLVEQAIPDVEMVHGRPIVRSDGSLEFTGLPPSLPGYRQQGPRLYPAWRPCTLRMLRVQVVDGLLSIAGVCGSPQAKRFSLEVTVDHCRTCLVSKS